MGEVDEIFAAVATVRGRQPPAVMDAVKDTDDSSRRLTDWRLAIYAFVGRLDVAGLDLAGLDLAAAVLARLADLRLFFAAAFFAVARAGEPFAAAASAGFASTFAVGLAAVRGFRGVLPLAFCAASKGRDSASVNRSESAAFGSEAISPSWLT
ncbi:MAG TPA: hypothetical protein VM782_13060 [Stellaceae bacterium]|nr:hypothetical protein [Stellaceae bacterium]